MSTRRVVGRRMGVGLTPLSAVHIVPTMSLQGRYLMLAAATAGAAGMWLEMAAARLLLPYYGDTQAVWANLIGLVLLALAVGSYVGGWAADRGFPQRGLGLLLVAVGAWAGAVPAFGHMLRAVGRLAPMGDVGLVVGSLVAIAGLLLLPMLALGCVPTYVVRTLLRDERGVGRVTGRVYGVATLGSMAGTFVPVLWTMPAWGVRASFWILSGVLVGIGLLGVAVLRARTTDSA